MRALPALILLAACESATPPTAVERAESYTCGPGTTRVGNECVAPPPLECGLGTRDDAGTCLPASATRLTLRAPRKIGANSLRPIDIEIFATDQTGAPASEDVVLSIDRASAGMIDPATVAVGLEGGATRLVSCDATTAGCLGPFELRVARASEPGVVLARVASELVEQVQVGSIERCRAGGNVFHLDGSGLAYPGDLTVTNATFTKTGGTMRSDVRIAPADPFQGPTWWFEISTVQIQQLLLPGTYLDTRDFDDMHPNLRLRSELPYPYLDCTYGQHGEFQIHAFDPSTRAITVSFRIWCSNDLEKVVSGCLHVE